MVSEQNKQKNAENEKKLLSCEKNDRDQESLEGFEEKEKENEKENNSNQ